MAPIFLSIEFYKGIKKKNDHLHGHFPVIPFRVPTRQGKVREICFFFKVREKSGNSVKWSGKLESLQKSGKSQGI